MILALEHSSLILCNFGVTVLVGRIGLGQLSARLDFSDGMNLPPEPHRTLKLLPLLLLLQASVPFVTTVRGIGTSTSGIGSGAKFDVTLEKLLLLLLNSSGTQA